MDNVKTITGKQQTEPQSVPELLGRLCNAAIHGGVNERGVLARMLMSPLLNDWATKTDLASLPPALRRTQRRG